MAATGFAIRMTGPAARVQWGYTVAAQLRDWTYTSTPSGDTFTATATEMNTVRLSQQPLVLVVPRRSTTWRYPVTSLQIAGETVTVHVGPCEE